jgi:hypothetical protein
MDQDDTGEPIRCLLSPYPSPWKPWKKRRPPLVIDVGKDAIRVSDSNTNALIASAAPAQMTATPAERTIDYDERREDVLFGGDSYHHVKYTQPYLVLRAPGLQPLFITINAMNWDPIQYRFSWCGTVEQTKEPGYLAMEAEFLALVQKFGLAPNLEDRTAG